MNTISERFFKFIKKDKTRSLLAFLFYFLFIFTTTVNLPLILQIISYIVVMVVTMLGIIIYIIDSTEKSFEQREERIGKKIQQEFKKIAKEIIMFIPVLLVSVFIISFFMLGEPANQSSINESFKQSPILLSIEAIIIAPLLEEYIFRFLPYKFIKNKILYIIISAVVFAAMHVVNDPNPFYYIWFYMIRPLYYGYRYKKTEDIWVTISLHSFNNFIAILLMLV